MDTKQLTTFITLAELGNYMRAADRLNYAPSTLAKHIHSLEEELGVKLVERRDNRIFLTPDGDRFYGYARRMLEIYWDAEEAFADRDNLDGSIHIAGGEPIVGYSMSDHFLAFSSRYPKVEVNVQMTCCARIPAWLRAREIDIGYIHEMEPVESDQYESVPLYNEPICLLTTRRNPLADRSGVGYGDLTGQKFAFTYDDCCFTMAFRERMRREGVLPHSELFLGSVSAVLRSVAAGDRIALVPYTSLPHLRDKGLVCLPWRDEPLRAWVQILYEHNRRLNLAEREIVGCARRFAQDLIEQDQDGQLFA